METSLYKKIYKMMGHEIVHLNQKVAPYRKRIFSLSKDKYPKSLEMRQQVGIHFHIMMREGSAMYIEHYSTNSVRTEIEVEAMYQKSKKKAEKIKRLLNKFLIKIKAGKIAGFTTMRLKDNLRSLVYNGGEYMCERIVRSNSDENIDTILKMKDFQFIRKYENSEIKNGQKPIVSLNSKKGILDYNQILAELDALNR